MSAPYIITRATFIARDTVARIKYLNAKLVDVSTTNIS